MTNRNNVGELLMEWLVVYKPLMSQIYTSVILTPLYFFLWLLFYI